MIYDKSFGHGKKPLFFFLFILLFLTGCKKAKENPDIYILDVTANGIVLNSDYRNYTVARKNTWEINEALKKAASDGYHTIKFPKGLYTIVSEWGPGRSGLPDTTKYPWQLLGILVPANVTLDLTEATFRLHPNDNWIYSLFVAFQSDNATLKGGHLVGDRYEHVFTYHPLHFSHEWGFGVNVLNSQNVLIEGMKIEQMTGDAVIINGMDRGRQLNTNIRVVSCELFDCRRQGISHVSGVHCEFSYNIIHTIKGTPPQSGIDIEVEATYGHIGHHIDIHHNRIFNCNGAAIVAHTGDYVNIFDNKVWKGIGVVNSQFVRIFNNTLVNASVYVQDNTTAEVHNNIFLTE